MPVTFPWSPSAQPPLMAYVPVRAYGKPVFLLILTAKVMTCPSTDVDVRETSPSVKVPVTPTAICGSKQVQSPTCTTPLTELSDCVILPTIVAGGIPGRAVEVVLICQLPEMFWPSVGGPEGGLEEGAEALTPPPHPQSRTTAESSHAVLDKCVTDLAPWLSWPPWADGAVVRSWVSQVRRDGDPACLTFHSRGWLCSRGLHRLYPCIGPQSLRHH